MLIWQIAVVVIDLAIVIAALIGFRYGMSALIGVHAKDELDKKDNFAFGIAVAGGVLALMLIMSGAVSGIAQASLLNEAINVAMYAVLGIVLLKVGFLIQDRLLLRSISLAEEIKSGNVSAALVAAVNLIAVGIIVRGAITWVEAEGVRGIVPVLLVFVASQAVLGAVTFLRFQVYSKRNDGTTWQSAIKANNLAIALRFAGQLFATSLVVASVGHVISYSSTLPIELGYTWLGFSLAAVAIVWVIYRLVLPIVLSKVNIAQEVDRQQNIGVAAIEAAIFVGPAAIIMGFVA